MSDAHIRDGKWSSTFALKELGAGCGGLGDKSAELLGGLVLVGERFEDAFTCSICTNAGIFAAILRTTLRLMPAITSTTIPRDRRPGRRSARSRRPALLCALTGRAGSASHPARDSASSQIGVNCQTACARSHIGVETKIPSQSMNAVARPSPNTVLRGAMSPWQTI